MRGERVTFHSGASDDVQHAWEWYSEQSESAAYGFLAELERAVRLLTSQPFRWPKHKQGTRRYVMRRFPFSIIYRVLPDDSVHVLAIAHGRRKPGYWKKRV